MLARVLAPTAAPLDGPALLAAAWAAITPDRSAQLTREFAEFVSADEAFLFSSGKAALTVLLEALATLRPARSVAIPAYTCYSVPASVVRAGLNPVLIDVDPRTLDFDESSLREVLQRTDLLCVLPTHLFGVSVDVERVRSLCRADVFVVEDAAQALGVTGQDGRLVGTRGDATLFSLARGKHLTCGHGGIIAVRHPEIANACRALYAEVPAPSVVDGVVRWIELAVMAVCIKPRLYWLPSSLPFLGLGRSVYATDFSIARLPAVSVGAMHRWRARLVTANRARQQTVERFRAANGASIDGESAPLLRYPLLMDSVTQRDQLIETGKPFGAGTMYPTSIAGIPELRDRFAGQRYPGAEILATRLATLPTHQYVRASDVAALQAICDRVRHRLEPTGAGKAVSAC
jgi:dTDP-4-amino-4,6-dideoxygalactose transaminase